MIHFYTNCNHIDDENYLYKEYYKTIELENSTDMSVDLIQHGKSDTKQAVNTTWCKYVNHLRNGFRSNSIPSDLFNNTRSVYSFDLSITDVYPISDRLLVKDKASWFLFDINSKTILQRNSITNSGTAISLTSENFYVIDHVVEEYLPSGSLINCMMHYAGKLDFYDVLRIGNSILFCGIQNDPNRPEWMPPYAMLQLISEKDLLKPNEDNLIRDLTRKNVFTYTEYDPVIPVFTDKQIFQPFSNGIIVLDFNLHVDYVLKTRSKPQFCSTDNSCTMIYIIAITGDNHELLICSADGTSLKRIPLPFGFNNPVVPPLVSENNIVILVSDCCVLGISSQGEIIWDHYFTDTRQFAAPYPIIYNETLIICKNQTLTVLDINTGDIIYLNTVTDHMITTPFIYNGISGFIGTDKGLYEFYQK